VTDHSGKSNFDTAKNAKRLYATLYTGRKSNEITPTKPISGSEIARRASVVLKQEVSTVEVREWVHYLRAKLKYPIGSTGEGYFLCTFRAEWQTTKRALLARIKNQSEAAYGPDEYYDKNEQLSLTDPPATDNAPDKPPIANGELDNHPVVQELKEKFGAVQV